jgi:putative ubiquitin-RnfH superfamily antitoxin RatB of RatAB toxin-antitoxin module
MEHAEQMTVEVAYALPERQVIFELVVDRGTTLEQAIKLSGIFEQFTEIDLDKNRVGVFGKLAQLSDVLQPGDRVEIYRPLIADPKEVRKQRAADGKATKKGGGKL